MHTRKNKKIIYEEILIKQNLPESPAFLTLRKIDCAARDMLGDGTF